MRRREFLKLTGGAAIAAGGIVPEFQELYAETEADEPLTRDSHEFYVSPGGNDHGPGTKEKPFATLSRAQRAVRKAKHRGPTHVWIGEGSYYFDSPLTFGPEDSGTPDAPVIYTAYPGADVVLSGGRSLSCRWIPHKDGIMKASVPAGLNFTQMFVNGKRQIRARYPNYDPSQPGKSGYLQAAGSIPKGDRDPYAGPDADMTFSGEASARCSIRSRDVSQQALVESRRCGDPYFSGGLLGKSAMAAEKHRSRNTIHLVRRRWAADWC